MIISKCSRTGDIIEPLLLPQWFVDTPTLAKPILESIKSNELKIYPNIYKNECIRWLEKPQPWCISRQIIWGHKIPAYNISDKNNKEIGWAICKKEDLNKTCLEKYNLKENEYNAIQDKDVLDTWFSSCLLPLSTQNWPDNLNKNSYPLSLMETGSDILFFWVLRQTMLCKKLSNELPFKTIYLHPIVRDASGKKMSKSLGNVIDPLDVIYGTSKDKMINKLKESNLPIKELNRSMKMTEIKFPKGIEACGTDALRFSLLTFLKQNRSINMNMNNVYSIKRFCNKIWNAVKYLEIHNINAVNDLTINKVNDSIPLPLHSLWILSKLSSLISSIIENMNNYKFSRVINDLTNFFLHDFCDVYLEFSKVDFNSIYSSTTSQILGYVIHQYFLLLHPFMPYLTQYLYDNVLLKENKYKPLDNLTYPNPNNCNYYNQDIENEFSKILDIIHHIRSFQSLCVTLKSDFLIKLSCKNEDIEFYSTYKPYIQQLTNLNKIPIV